MKRSSKKVVASQSEMFSSPAAFPDIKILQVTAGYVFECAGVICVTDGKGGATELTMADGKPITGKPGTFELTDKIPVKVISAPAVNQGSVKVEVKVTLLVDKKGNGMFEFFASVPVIKRGKLVSPVASAEVGVEWVGPLLPTQNRADMMRVA